MKIAIVLAVLMLPVAALGQVSVDWVVDTEGVSVALDSAANVYTVSYDYNPAGDILLTKRNADGAFQWEAKFDQTSNSNWEKATWVATDHQNNILVTGTLMSGYSNPVNAASILMKFNPSGDLVWRVVYENSFDGSYTKKCLVDEEDNIYVLGMGSGQSGFVTKVKKFAPDGTAVWSYFDGDGIGAPVNFKFSPDSGIVIAARAIFGSVNGYAKIDRSGNKVWSFPGVNSVTVGDADGDAFGNTYLVHAEYVFNGGTELKKISPSGSLLWSRVYDLAAFRVEVGSDNQPVICGFPNQGSGGASFLKTDGNGDIVWTNPNADGPYALLMHAHLVMDPLDNIYLAAGTLTEMAVCKVNSDGSSAWTATTPGSYANAIILGSDLSVFVVGGSTARLNQAASAAAPDVEGVDTKVTILEQNSPNPCKAWTTIAYTIPARAHVSLQVHGVTGRTVGLLVNEVQGPGRKTVEFDTDGLADGVYYYRLLTGSATQTGKLTLAR